ncbi:MAG: UDP-2,3-diacylglucosamine diphosphatase [Robiginitalea sp.]|uniref:UDP-2,3-diacylglucosamine diphosphatase n=1 Tax=Robiginitalea sp. TaxID=1902411 RepID=UPI003C76DC7E
MKKRLIEIAVISNTHLGAESGQADALLAYLSSISPKILVLNGTVWETKTDIQKAFSSRHFGILKKLFAMSAAGTKIYYVCEYPDAVDRKFKEKAPGNIYVTANLILNLDGKKAWFTHGDFLDSPLFDAKWVQRLGTGGLRILAETIRYKNRVWNTVNRHATEVCRPPGSDRENRLKKGSGFSETIVKLAVGRGCDYLICGAPQDLCNLWLETRAGKCQYLSAGDWVENLTTLEYNFKRWKPYRYSEDKLSPFFADEDLKQMNVKDILAKNLKTGSALAG